MRGMQRDDGHLMTSPFEVQTEPTEAVPGQPDLRLTDRQFVLEGAFRERSPNLADMFLGAVVVLTQEANPERWVHAAHSVREIMQKIYDVFEPTIKFAKEAPTLGTKVDVLIQRWNRRVLDVNEGAVISGYLASFLRDFAEFVEWKVESRPAQKARAAQALTALDPSRTKLPPSIQEARVEEWYLCLNFFVEVLHHKREWTHDEFYQWLEYFEQLMVTHLRPQTYETHAIIDDLIARAEGHAS
jgi:hypothetical protein